MPVIGTRVRCGRNRGTVVAGPMEGEHEGQYRVEWDDREEGYTWTDLLSNRWKIIDRALEEAGLE